MPSYDYYYLVSGLPDLLIEDNKFVPTFRTFMDEVADLTEPDDFDVISAMALPIDNRNLISMVEGTGAQFDPRGRFTREDFGDLARPPDELPHYMQAFLDAHRDNRQLFPGLTPIDQLSWLFYDEMADSENEFLREWHEFDLGLRNVAAGLNIRKGLTHIEAMATERDRPEALSVIGRGDIAEAVLRSTAPDFGLGASYPWVERVIALSHGTLTEMEKGLDEIRWEMLGELTTLSYFQAETVAVTAQKLLIVERWMSLEPAAGKVKLDKLVEELMGSFVMPAGF
jgi:hypothetical protein